MAFLSLGPMLPTVEISVDFANDPTSSTRTWVDVTPYVREFSTKRGRPDALSRITAGTLALTLQNQDGRFDPTNTAGPYYPNVLPMRRIRVLAQWNSVTYNVFHGYVEDWPLSFPNDGKNALVHVRAVDALAILPLFDLGGQSYASEVSSVRGSAVFTTCGFGTADMSISAGQSTLVASGTITVGNDALAHLLDVQASENGLVFADTGGTLVFQDRHFRPKNRSTSSGTIGTGSGLIGYRDIRTSYGVSDLWNAVTVTASGGTAETAVDASSTASYYKRSLTWPVGGSYLVASQAEALSAAQHVRGLYAQPALRVPEVAVVGAGGTANWATILAFEISSRATLAHVTPAGGTITGEKYVEGIGHRVTFERDWETAVQLSDAPAQAVWILGDANFSKLGETTVLGY